MKINNQNKAVLVSCYKKIINTAFSNQMAYIDT